MAPRPNDPALHCKVFEFIKLNILAHRLIKGIYASENANIFIKPIVAFDDFKEAAEELDRLIIQATKNRYYKKLRKAQCKVVFKYVKKLLLYVKIVADHNLTIIILSGFENNRQPQKNPVPGQPCIYSIIVGKEKGTYKVTLTRKNNALLVEKDPSTHLRNVRYRMEISLDQNDSSSWIDATDLVSRTKLIFTNFIPGKKNWIRVFAVNSAGTSQPSNAVPFTPQIP